MRRISGLTDEQIHAYELRIEAATRLGLQRVMDALADRIASIQVLVAADGTEEPDAGQQPDVPEGDGLPPGQPYVSPDDLATIPPAWSQVVAENLLPIVAEVLVEASGAVYASMLEATGGAAIPSVGSLAAETYLAQAKNTFDFIGDDLWGTAQQQLLDGFERGESIPQLAERLRSSAGMTAKSATLTARTSIIEASNGGSIATARASGLQMQKEWIATPDPRTRPTHIAADGQRVDLNEKFIVGGYSADFPADPSLPYAERLRCRCTLGYLMPEREARTAQEDLAPAPPLPGESPGVEIPSAPEVVVPALTPDVFPSRPAPSGDLGDDFIPADQTVIRPELRGAASLRDLQQAWRAEWQRVTGNDILIMIPNDASLLTMRQYAEGLLQAAERFPDVRLREISWFTDERGAYAMLEPGTGGAGSAMRFNSWWAADAQRQTLLRSMRNDVKGWTSPAKSGWSVRGATSPAATSYHEFAHALDLSTLGRRTHARVLALVERRAVMEGVEPDTLVARDISAYAGSDTEELIAEAVTDVFVNGQAASAISREIYSLLVAEYRAAGLGIRMVPRPDVDLEDFGDEVDFSQFPSLPAPGLASRTVPQLRALAAERGVTIPAGARKADIVRLLEEPGPSVDVPTPLVTAHLRSGASMDAKTWTAERIDGLPGSDRAALTAVTSYVRQPGFVNTRLRTPIPDTDPKAWKTWLHEPSIDEMLGRAPFDEAAERAAVARADKMIAAFDRVLDRSRITTPMTTYRGASVADIGLPEPGAAVGHTWTDAGYVSTSSTRSVASGSFGGGSGRVTLDIRSPQGTPALRIEGLGEDEVLLGRGLTFRVVEDGRGPGGSGRVVVEVEPPSAPTSAAPVKALTDRQIATAARAEIKRLEADRNAPDRLAGIERAQRQLDGATARIKAGKRGPDQDMYRAQVADEVGKALSELDEMVHAAASARAIETRLTTLGYGLHPDVLDDLLRAGRLGPGAVNVAIDAIAERHGLVRITGRSGDVEPFDPAKHEMAGRGAQPPVGSPVRVFRPAWAMKDSDRQLSRASVSVADDVPTATVAPTSRAANADIESRARTGVVKGSEVKPDQGVSAVTRRVQFEDGSFGYRKVGHGDDTMDDEYLATLAMQATGVRAPGVYRADRRTIFLEEVEGDLGRAIDDRAAYDALMETADARLIGLGDAIVGVGDRQIHGANIIRTADDRLVPIDNAPNLVVLEDGKWRFQMPRDHSGRALPMQDNDSNDFSAIWVDQGADGYGARPKVGGELDGEYLRGGDRVDVWREGNDLTRAEYEAIRGRLEALRPEFTALRRTKQLDYMVDRLDGIWDASRFKVVEPAVTTTKAAVARQAAIDKARAVGNLGADVLEQLENGMTGAALRTRITQTAARLGTPDKVRDALLAAVDDPAALRQAVAASLRGSKIDIVAGDAGTLVRFDRRTMQAIDGTIPDDAHVLIVKPGLSFLRGKERIQISKATVEVATPEEVLEIERRATRAAARVRQREIEQANGTANLLAEMDELIARKADPSAILQRLDPALIARDSGSPFAGADPAVLTALREAAADAVKLKAAVTRLSTKAKIKAISRSGAKVKFDPDTMDTLPGAPEIKAGTPVTIVTRGSTVTLPDGTVMQLRKAVATPVAKPVKAPRVAKAKPGSTIGDVELGPTQFQVAIGDADMPRRPRGDFQDRPFKGAESAVVHRGEGLPAGFTSRLEDVRRGEFKVRPGLTDAESQALDRYVLSAVADPLNGALRAGRVPPFGTVRAARQDVDLDETARDLDSAIAASELRADTKLYRGALMRPADLRKLQPGAITSESGYLSTSTDLGKAFEIIGWRKGRDGLDGRSEVLFTILAPKGTRAAVAHVDELEVLLGRGRRFRVIDNDPPGRGRPRSITLEILPEGS